MRPLDGLYSDFTLMETYQYASFYLMDKETEKNKKENQIQPLFTNMWFKNYFKHSFHIYK